MSNKTVNNPYSELLRLYAADMPPIQPYVYKKPYLPKFTVDSESTSIETKTKRKIGSPLSKTLDPKKPYSDLRKPYSDLRLGENLTSPLS